MSEHSYSARVLEETPARVTKFLAGVAAVPQIQAALYAVGFGAAESARGRELLMNSLAMPLLEKAGALGGPKTEQHQAAGKLDQMDEPDIARIKAALERYNPSLGMFVLGDLTAGRGSVAVQNMATLVSRLDRVVAGDDPARKEHSKEDQAALEILAKRGYDATWRKEIHALVQTALGPDNEPITLPEPGAPREAALVELKRWYDDWAETARAVIKKRGHLIRLGLAHRREPVEDDA